MSNIIKESLQENLDQILENLPSEFHSDLKASIDAATPTPRLSTEEAKEQAAQLMKENPDIQDEECIALLDGDNLINQAIQQPKDEELELQKKQSIAEIQAALSAE